MKQHHLQLTFRGGIALVSAVAVLGLSAWAFADSGVPLISSSAPDPTTTTGPSTPAPAGAAGDNVAVASNTKDGRTVVAVSLKIVQTSGANVDPVNAAVAAASCTDCETVAIALEGVLVAGDPTTFDPTNVALALNTDCTNCQTLATAYQDVVQNDTRVRITGAGRKEIAAVRQDLDSLRKSGLDILAIQQRVNDDAGRFLAVLQHDVVPIGRPAETGDPTTTTTTSPSSQAPTVTSAPSSTTSTTLTSSTTSPTSPSTGTGSVPPSTAPPA